MRLWPRSLQGQLALRLAVVFMVVSAAGVGLLLWQGSDAADSFGLEMLRYRTAELARHLSRSPDGRAELNLPPDLAKLYRDQKGVNLYAIRTATGQTLASGKMIAHEVATWHFDRAPHNFRLEEFGPGQDDYYGLAVTEDSPIGPVGVAVAHSSDADAIAVAMLRYFAGRIAWMIPLFAFVTLLIGIWSIRTGLRSLTAISQRASQIDPRSNDVRLPTEGLPSELVPLVQAVNSAFDRLQEGFAVQRRFTANAAHELRTPLTMLTAGLDELGDGTAIAKLRADVARMNRLVAQLLRVARLDAIPVNLAARVDLGQVAAGVVEYLAPWAIARGRFIALEDVFGQVRVRGNADEIGDAIRNLVENAVLHAPSGTEVTVRVSTPGSVTVDDQGPGVPAADRSRIFGRFWRGKGTSAPGAGLGLSIVAEIVRLHDGTVEVGDAPGGGASFRLTFQPA
jgi:signal transduction histidine kinase